MTRSNFDPDNPDRDPGMRGGLDRFLGPPARERSSMPPDLTDGKDADADAPEDNDLSHEALSPDDAAESLKAMTEPHPGEQRPSREGP